MAVGVGYGSTTAVNIPTPTIQSLHAFYEQLVAEIQKMGYREIVLSYNNLEIIEPKELTRLFNSIRDFIQTKNTKFIFIGGTTVSETIGNMPRVQSIMAESPIILQNLSLAEIKELLEKRIRQLSIGGLQHINPYTHDALALLYSLHAGNLRYILNALSTALKGLVKDTPLVVSGDDLKIILPEIVKNRWLIKLTPLEKDVLTHILNNGEVTNKQIAGDLKKLKQNISPVTNKLRALCAIKAKSEGNEKFFTVEPSIKWLLLEARGSERPSEVRVSNEIQRVLGNYSGSSHQQP